MPGHASADSPLTGLSPAELQAILKLAMGAADLGLFQWMPQDDVFVCAAEGCSLLGIAEEAGGLDRVIAAVQCDDRARLRHAMGNAAGPGDAFDLLCRTAAPAGRVLRIMGAFAAGADGRSGRVVGFVAQADQTADLAAEPAAGGDPYGGQLADLVASSDDAIIGTTLDGVVTSWNRAASRIFGHAARDMIGRPVFALAVPGLDEDMPRILARIGRGERVEHYETVRRHQDGRLVHVSLTVSPVHDSAGRLVGASKVARDLTERYRAEARLHELQSELLHVSRLSAMGQMAALLAHEVNQPLTAVMNYAEAARQMLAGSALPAPPKVAEFVQKAAGQAERAGQIIRRLRGFVEKRAVERAPARLSQVVEEASALATIGTAGENIRVTLDLAPDLPPIVIDRIQIQQVVVNLVRNAVEVLRQVEPNQVERRPVDRRVLAIRTAAAADGGQEVAVSDTGPGIPPELAADLFKPFVSGKKGGMGVGLSISRSIIEAHGGRLWAEPNPEGGSVFRFVLPAAVSEEESR